MMDTNPDLEEYIISHIDKEPPELNALYRHTYMHCLYPRMCSGHYQGRLLKMLVAMINPSAVLELGTFTGYSTMCIAEGLQHGASVDTIEIDEEKEAELIQRFSESPYAEQIKLHIGDALNMIGVLDKKWDLVYIDANKRNYLDYLEAVYQKVPIGGFILVDNTLWDMKVIDPEKGIDPQTAAIIEFNDFIVEDKRFEKVILPVRDGLTILRKVL